MTLPIVVTRHAMRRYLERIMGFDFAACDRHRLGDYLSVHVACDELGIDPDFIAAKITNEVDPRLPEIVRLRGSRRVVTGETAKFIIEGGRYVMTVYPTDWRRDEQGLARDRSAA